MRPTQIRVAAGVLGAGVLWHCVADGIFSAYLLPSILLQCLAVALLGPQVLAGKVSGISTQIWLTDVLALCCRLSTKDWFIGNRPLDASGDYILRALGMMSLGALLGIHVAIMYQAFGPKQNKFGEANAHVDNVAFQPRIREPIQVPPAKNSTPRAWRQAKEDGGVAQVQEKTTDHGGVAQVQEKTTDHTQIPRAHSLVTLLSQLNDPGTKGSHGGKRNGMATRVRDAESGKTMRGSNGNKMPWAWQDLCQFGDRNQFADKFNDDTSLRSNLQKLALLDPECIFMVRKINGLGLKSPEFLREYFKQFGAVKDVFVTHAIDHQRTQNPCPDVKVKVRPAGFGFVAMEKAEDVRTLLEREAAHIIHGVRVCISKYEHRGPKESTEGMIKEYQRQ